MSSLPTEIIKMILAPAVHKKLFSKPNVPIQRYLGCYQQAFETGAVLGHAFRKEFSWLIQFFSEPGKQYQLAKAFSQLAIEYLKEFEEPTSFFQLAMEREESRIRKLWENSGQTPNQIERFFRDWKFEPEEAFNALSMALNTGVALGGTYPKLVETLWSNAYEASPDPRKVELLRSAGLKIPADKFQPIPLQTQEKMLLSAVRSFLVRNHPELITQFESQFE